MDVIKNTPVKSIAQLKMNSNIVTIPPSPMMQKLGYGTGVAVYRMERSPVSNKLQSPWAVKKLLRLKTTTPRKEIAKRIKDEADLLRKLKHPNVVGFRALVQSNDGNYILAMEECTTCLGNLIEHRNEADLPPYPAKNISKVSKDISKALQYLHDEALVLHCDIKSYNILICGDFDVCKLCDFGIALPITKEGMLDRTELDEEIEYGGTVSWCAPELLKKDQIITTKADIYAYGLVLWEMMELDIPPTPDDNDYDDEDEIVIRQRPNLPNYDFGPEYQLLLEIFYCCTDEDFNKRPSARHLKDVFVNMVTI